MRSLIELHIPSLLLTAALAHGPPPFDQLCAPEGVLKQVRAHNVGPSVMGPRNVERARSKGPAQRERPITWEVALGIAQRHIRAEHLEDCWFAVLPHRTEVKPAGWLFRLQEWDLVSKLCSGIPPPDNRSDVVVDADGQVGQFRADTSRLTWRKCESAWRTRHLTAYPAIMWHSDRHLRFRPLPCPAPLECNMLAD